MMQCEYCDNEIPTGVSRCPSCGAAVKVVASLPQQQQTQNQVEPPMWQSQMRTGVYTGEEPIELKNKWCFILLGVFLGAFGIHNFYAGYVGRGIVKLLVTILSGLWLSWVSLIWAIVEVCTVRIDAKGRPFTTGSI